jgi:hypothetical protein
MKRVLLAILLCAFVVSVASADVPIGSMTFYAKYVTPDGNTHPLTGFVMYGTSNGFSGLTPWTKCWLNDKGACRIDLPLPVICWSGTDACFTLNGQWVYWTIAPLYADTCTLSPSGNPQARQGVTWIATQKVIVGTVWEGECQRGY